VIIGIDGPAKIPIALQSDEEIDCLPSDLHDHFVNLSLNRIEKVAPVGGVSDFRLEGVGELVNLLANPFGSLVVGRTGVAIGI
jgi:hypothetical protein